MQKKESGRKFITLLKHYLSIKGLDIVIHLKDGNKIELNKNRSLDNDLIITKDRHNREVRISVNEIKSVDLFAA